VRYVYFLRLATGDIYVKPTNDLRRRFESHARGEVTLTKANLSVALQSYVVVKTDTLARNLERYFKSGSAKAFVEKRFP